MVSNNSIELSAWVTGASGFLGRYIARKLALKNFFVIGTSRNSMHNHQAWGISKHIPADFSFSHLANICSISGPPSIIVHCIGSGTVKRADLDPDGDYRRTVLSTAIVLDFMRKISPKTRLIYISSAAVYGIAGSGVSSQTALMPVSTYGRNKLQAETLCLRSGLDVRIARPFSIFGSPQRKLLFWDVGRQILDGNGHVVLFGTGAERRDFLHVTAAASAIVLMAQSPDCAPIVDVGTGQSETVEVAAGMFSSLLNPNSQVRFNCLRRPGDPVIQEADVENLIRIGFRPSSNLVFGLKEYGSWLVLDRMRVMIDKNDGH